jgi:YVTN family beta-propeller protein
MCGDWAIVLYRTPQFTSFFERGPTMRRIIHSLLGVGLAALASGGLAAAGQAAPTYSVVDHIQGPDGRWDYASFDPARRRVYIAHGVAVTAIDVDTKTVTAEVAKGAGLHSAFALPGGDVLVTTNGAANTAEFLDARSGAVLATVPVGQDPDAAIFDPGTGLVLVMNGHGGDVSLVDAASRKVTGVIPVGGALEFVAADGAGRAYVNIEDKGEIAVLDLKAKSVVARYSLNGCEEPSGLILAKEAGVLISACANGMAKVIRAATGEEVATLSIGKKPDAVLWDEQRRLAFIPSGGAGTLSVIAVRGPSDVAVVQTVPTQVGARTGAVDPKTGRIYLPTAKFLPAQGGGRPTIVPGSFEVLVVAPN